MRKTQSYPIHGANSLQQVYQNVPFWRVMKNFLVIQLARYMPLLPLKNWLYRTFLGMTVGKDTSVALMVMLDILHPEKISIGDNCVIGYNTTILTHEYLLKEYRLGEVVIGSNVVIGANATILPGISIGDYAVVAAGAVVAADVAANTFVGGVPARIIREQYYQEPFG